MQTHRTILSHTHNLSNLDLVYSGLIGAELWKTVNRSNRAQDQVCIQLIKTFAFIMKDYLKDDQLFNKRHQLQNNSL